MSIRNTQQMKDDLLKVMMNDYAKFGDLVRSLPLSDTVKSHVFLNFDQGFMWLEKGMKNLVIEPPTPPADAA